MTTQDTFNLRPSPWVLSLLILFITGCAQANHYLRVPDRFVATMSEIETVNVSASYETRREYSPWAADREAAAIIAKNSADLFKAAGYNLVSENADLVVSVDVKLTFSRGSYVSTDDVVGEEEVVYLYTGRKGRGDITLTTATNSHVSKRYTFSNPATFYDGSRDDRRREIQSSVEHIISILHDLHGDDVLPRFKTIDSKVVAGALRGYEKFRGLHKR